MLDKKHNMLYDAGLSLSLVCIAWNIFILILL